MVDTWIIIAFQSKSVVMSANYGVTLEHDLRSNAFALEREEVWR
jgi:hypothetical protein